jgi:hypothetical protein
VSQHIDVPGQVPAGLVLQRRGAADTRVGAVQVDLAEVRDRRRDERLDALGGRGVARDRERARTQLAGHRRGLGLVQVVDDDPRALRREPPCQGRADARPASGDHYARAVQFHAVLLDRCAARAAAAAGTEAAATAFPAAADGPGD